MGGEIQEASFVCQKLFRKVAVVLQTGTFSGMRRLSRLHEQNVIMRLHRIRRLVPGTIQIVPILRYAGKIDKWLGQLAREYSLVANSNAGGSAIPRHALYISYPLLVGVKHGSDGGLVEDTRREVTRGCPKVQVFRSQALLRIVVMARVEQTIQGLRRVLKQVDVPLGQGCPHWGGARGASVVHYTPYSRKNWQKDQENFHCTDSHS